MVNNKNNSFKKMNQYIGYDMHNKRAIIKQINRQDKKLLNSTFSINRKLSVDRFHNE